MRTRLHAIAVPLMLGLAGCVTAYSKTEAPNRLQVDGGETWVDLVFAPGSARLAQGEAARLDQLMIAGSIRPADRVTIAAAGPPGLARQRAAAISSELLRYGIVADTLALDVPPNRAIVGIGRYAVTLPPCPNWSQPPTYDFGNAYSSYYGCATATNLGLMVASPADLVSGRPLGLAEGMPAVSAVERYLNDRVKPPPSPTASPFAASTSGGGDTGGGGGAGAGGGAPP
jgi:pilus assembly protein CpaD